MQSTTCITHFLHAGGCHVSGACTHALSGACAANAASVSRRRKQCFSVFWTRLSNAAFLGAASASAVLSAPAAPRSIAGHAASSAASSRSRRCCAPAATSGDDATSWRGASASADEHCKSGWRCSSRFMRLHCRTVPGTASPDASSCSAARSTSSGKYSRDCSQGAASYGSALLIASQRDPRARGWRRLARMQARVFTTTTVGAQKRPPCRQCTRGGAVPPPGGRSACAHAARATMAAAPGNGRLDKQPRTAQDVVVASLYGLRLADVSFWKAIRSARNAYALRAFRTVLLQNLFTPTSTLRASETHTHINCVHQRKPRPSALRAPRRRLRTLSCSAAAEARRYTMRVRVTDTPRQHAMRCAGLLASARSTSLQAASATEREQSPAIVAEERGPKA